MAGIRAKRKAERPGEILEAAFEEFVRRGYAATRLEDVAARIGVTKGTIYFYFGSKEALFEAMVIELGKGPLEELHGGDTPWTGDIATDIHDYLKRLYRFTAENPRSREILRLLIAEATRFPALVDRHFAEIMQPCVDRLRERLAEGIAAGEVWDGPLAEMPEVVLGPALALNVMMLLFGTRRVMDPDRFLDAHVGLLLNGLVRRAPGPNRTLPASSC